MREKAPLDAFSIRNLLSLFYPQIISYIDHRRILTDVSAFMAYEDREGRGLEEDEAGF